ncbi:Fe-Mn family superoxide dismutase [Desulfobotulus alkaliphilus]|uniref:Superoxide dismutase n=1 Tax=Desulfobotulus alkaliphilus TaxID=622671 RepID=A0A562RYT8_9BACT|nr:superoxide dismutase [Desulfobotulus alkaliphilus]TWI74023.1 Fe-Mn family superoxide dismutase [Desulfobotulus alkaliphilus]
MLHTLPEIPYAYDALEPYIDARTMEIHHTKHHQTYVDKLNAALENHKELQQKTLHQLLKGIDTVPETIKTAVRNHGGGHANHTLFWQILKTGEKPGGEILKAIEDTFGSYENFERDFSTGAAGLFGSGWMWLVLDEKGKPALLPLPNQDSPIMYKKIPLLGLDVWEHAYYLKYQNRRPDYIKAFFEIIHWPAVNERYKAGLEGVIL